MEIVYYDAKIVVCIKEPGQLSTDEPGGVPEAVRLALGCDAVRTVHRLDRVVGGLMVVARTKRSAATLSAQMQTGEFKKAYLAVVHGAPNPPRGTMQDLLRRDKTERKTYVTTEPGRDAQLAVLDYELLDTKQNLSQVRIRLKTGRTHQIRAQFSSRGLPLCGDKKYNPAPGDCNIALFSSQLSFLHPATGVRMEFYRQPPICYPWDLFDSQIENHE